MCLWPNIDDLPEVKPLWKIPVSYQNGYDAGYNAAIDEAVETVDKCRLIEPDNYLFNEIIAAITALKK